uniref:Uncharacterized protein n=1 Tax=Anguilla anguilla TaxID=7936 RepID=A0A0E9UGE1_ANGAN
MNHLSGEYTKGDLKEVWKKTDHVNTEVVIQI